MATQEELLAEAARRGLLTPEEKAAYDEAKRRGLLERQLGEAQSLLASGENGPGIVSGLAGSVAQGLSFGFADELGAAARAAAGAPGPETFGDLYRNALLESKIARTQFGKAHPRLSLGAEVAGGIGQGGALLSAGKAAFRNIPPALRLAGAGAAEGAAFGAGTADPGQRLLGATFGAGIGAVGGPVIGGVASATGAALRPVVRKLAESLFDTPRSQAQRIIREAMDADDITPDEAVFLLRQMGPNATLSDLGENLTRQGRVAASQSGPGAARARTFLDERQRGQQHRLIESARVATGSEDFDKGVLEIVNGAASRSAPLYREAYRYTIQITPRLDNLMQRPAVARAKKKALTILQNEGLSGRVSDVAYMDAIKRALDDQIGAAVRAGRGNDVRILTNLKREFVSEIDSQVPAYKQARDIFAGEAAIRDAATAGRSILKPSTDAGDLEELVSNMSQSELQAFRSGVLRSLADSFSGTQETRDVAKRLADTPRFRRLIRLAFPSQEAFEKFLQTAQAETRFSQTRNTVLGGSPTARIQADRDAAVGGIMAQAFDAATSPGQAIFGALRSFARRDKLTPEVTDEMAKLLFDPRVIPSKVRAPVADVFKLPPMNPTVFSGRVGGAVGTQTQGIFKLLESMGVISPAVASEPQ